MANSWYPGHMAKTVREIGPLLKLIDVIIELVDARAPLSSSNPLIRQIAKDKPVILLLNKADLADPSATSGWVRHLKATRGNAVASDVLKGTGLDGAIAMLSSLQAKARIKPRALIIGMPNVGKSSLINRFAKRSKAKTGDKPGVTRGKQWIDIGAADLLDTPGLMPLKVEDQLAWNKLSALGIIADDLFSHEQVSSYLAELLSARYPGLLEERYGIAPGLDALHALEAIAIKRGCLLQGGALDMEKSYMTLIRDLRSGRLGRVSLEVPDES